MEKVKFSLATKFTLIVLLIIVIKAGVLSSVFFYNLHSISDRLAIANVERSIENLQNSIAFMLDNYAGFLDNASYGISVLFDQGIANTEVMSGYFDRLKASVPEMELLYFSGNIKWNLSGGYWITSPVWMPYEAWDQTERPWFINAKEAAGAVAFSDPFLDANTGGIIISVSRVVYDGEGRDVGVIAADMLVAKFNAEITRAPIFPEQLLYLINEEGFYITNQDPDKVMTYNFFAEHKFERYHERVLFNDSIHIQANSYDFLSVRIPQTDWYLVSVIPNSVIRAEPNRILMNMLLLSLITIIIAVFVSITFCYFMLNRPLGHILQVFKYLDSNDLTVQLDAISHDEIGNLKYAFNNFLKKLNSTFMAFKNNANMVSIAVYDISSSSREITATANEQSATVAEIVSTMESNKNLSSQVAVKTGNVAEMAVRTQELCQRGADLREANEDMMLDIQNQNAKIIEVIKSLADMFSRIDESVQHIDAFADNTKLIAFNAALEASSSGEAGARFAVVAGEIRRFADNVAESVVEIKERISELQEASQMLIVEADNGSWAIDEGYNRMVEQKKVFEDIVDTSQHVAINSQQISNLSKQQELASAQVFTALKEISAGVSQFVTATALTSVTAESLNKMSLELKESLAKYQIGNKETV